MRPLSQSRPVHAYNSSPQLCQNAGSSNAALSSASFNRAVTTAVILRRTIVSSLFRPTPLPSRSGNSGAITSLAISTRNTPVSNGYRRVYRTASFTTLFRSKQESFDARFTEGPSARSSATHASMPRDSCSLIYTDVSCLPLRPSPMLRHTFESRSTPKGALAVICL